MPAERFEIRISFRKLLMGMIILIVPLSILGWLISTNAIASLEQRNGAHFKQLAQTVADSAARFVDGRVAEVKTVSRVPTVVSAVLDANRSYGNMSRAAIQQSIGASGPESESRMEQVLSLPASRFLQQVRESNPRLIHVVLSDREGRVVAATDKPLLSNQRDQWYWKNAFETSGGPAVSSLLHDEKQQSAYVNIGMPVYDQESQVIGVLGAWVDVSALLNQFWQPPLGKDSHMLLVNEEGRVLSGPNITPWLRLGSDEFAAVQESFRTVEGRESGHTIASLKGGSRLIGFAYAWPGRTYPQLNWTVLVSQSTAETDAPLRPVVRFALTMVVLSLLALIAVAAYFAIHREESRTEVEIAHHDEPWETVA